MDGMGMYGFDSPDFEILEVGVQNVQIDTVYPIVWRKTC